MKYMVEGTENKEIRSKALEIIKIIEKHQKIRVRRAAVDFIVSDEGYWYIKDIKIKVAKELVLTARSL